MSLRRRRRARPGLARAGDVDQGGDDRRVELRPGAAAQLGDGRVVRAAPPGSCDRSSSRSRRRRRRRCGQRAGCPRPPGRRGSRAPSQCSWHERTSRRRRLEEPADLVQHPLAHRACAARSATAPRRSAGPACWMMLLGIVDLADVVQEGGQLGVPAGVGVEPHPVADGEHERDDVVAVEAGVGVVGLDHVAEQERRAAVGLRQLLLLVDRSPLRWRANSARSQTSGRPSRAAYMWPLPGACESQAERREDKVDPPGGRERPGLVRRASGRARPSRRSRTRTGRRAAPGRARRVSRSSATAGRPRATAPAPGRRHTQALTTCRPSRPGWRSPRRCSGQRADSAKPSATSRGTAAGAARNSIGTKTSCVGTATPEPTSNCTRAASGVAEHEQRGRDHAVTAAVGRPRGDRRDGEREHGRDRDRRARLPRRRRQLMPARDCSTSLPSSAGTARHRRTPAMRRLSCRFRVPIQPISANHAMLTARSPKQGTRGRRSALHREPRRLPPESAAPPSPPVKEQRGSPTPRRARSCSAWAPSPRPSRRWPARPRRRTRALGSPAPTPPRSRSRVGTTVQLRARARRRLRERRRRLDADRRRQGRLRQRVVHRRRPRPDHSLSLPAGSSATSPPMCIGLFSSEMRLFISNSGAATPSCACRSSTAAASVRSGRLGPTLGISDEGR